VVGLLFPGTGRHQEEEKEPSRNCKGKTARKYSAFKYQGNGLLSEARVARFSATTLPFTASENADVR
jgi:hypothetical protein